MNKQNIVADLDTIDDWNKECVECGDEATELWNAMHGLREYCDLCAEARGPYQFKIGDYDRYVTLL